MGKVKLIKLPPYLKNMVKESISNRRPMTREGATSFTREETEKYLRMYLSGYPGKLVAEYYGVTPSRVYNAIPAFTGRYYRQLSALNRKKRKLGHKLVTVEEFFDNEMYTPI